MYRIKTAGGPWGNILCYGFYSSSWSGKDVHIRVRRDKEGSCKLPAKVRKRRGFKFGIVLNYYELRVTVIRLFLCTACLSSLCISQILLYVYRYSTQV